MYEFFFKNILKNVIYLYILVNEVFIVKIVEKVQFENFNPESYVIADDIAKYFNDKELKEAYVIMGVFRDEAYEVLKDNFKNAKNNNVKVNFTVGIDRKSISAEVLKELLELSNNIYVYNNNVQDDFNAKIYIFKYEDKAQIIIPATNFTLKGITTDYSNVTKVEFDLPNDEQQYNEFMYGIKEYIYPDLNVFKLLNDEVIEELSLKRDLMVIKGKDSTLPSIEDYLKKTADMHKKISDEEVEEKIKEKLNDIIQEFDIQMDDNE